MNQKNAILVMNTVDGVDHIEWKAFGMEEIPESLNGESGFHVYNVRVLTELILQQYAREHTEEALTQEQIMAMAVASSLHDIGKQQVPQSILNILGKLSPLQYDIVKKHSVFGEAMIAAAVADGIDPMVIRYAKEIARGHHERYDGTGYPDGLRGADIPLSAQVVSLADAYDALTRKRGYKQAFTQDVALQMISGGMCGVFDERLVECLMKVVNESSLQKIRDQFDQGSTVVPDENEHLLKRVLLLGNTAYITQQFIDAAFPQGKVFLLGESSLHSGGRLKVMSYKSASVRSLLKTYEFDVILYFSEELTYGSDEKTADDLRDVLRYVKKTQSAAKFIYLSSLDCAFLDQTDESIICATKERLCEFYANEKGLDIRVVRIPYLYSGTVEKDFLYRIFSQLTMNGKIEIEQMQDDRMYFMSSADLAALVSRLIENWSTGGTLTVGDDFDLTFGALAEKLATYDICTSVEFSESSTPRTMTYNNKALRNQYGWFARISLIDDFDDEYEQYLISRKEKHVTALDKIKAWFQKHAAVVKTVELLLFFLLSEGLLFWTGTAVDYRMAFIVIMGTAHGLTFGLAAATLGSVSWFASKVLTGTSWLTIFYEPTNWLAFIFYFLVGAVCGYMQLKNQDKISEVKEENHVLEEKLVFTREIYHDTYREKNDLRKQIISSKDSFGKIFDITRKLDTVEPHLLYLKIIETFEDILENKSIAVYSVQGESRFGRLEVASRDIAGTVARSISTETYQPVINAFKDGEIWRNTDMYPDLPMYAAGVYRGEKLEQMIFLWQADMDQYSLYYVNLFKILRDLAQMSMLRAYEYNQAIYEKQYIPHTRLMNAEAFDLALASFNSLKEKKVFSYVLLDVDCKGRSYEEADGLLTSLVRVNDMLGASENGHVRILLSQATEDDLQFVLPRFALLDVEVTVIS